MPSSSPDTQQGDWWTTTESPKAWMSVRDADLYEELLHRLVALRGRRIRVVEWGAGRSTAWYTSFLDALGATYTWLSLEHHREFVDDHVRPALACRPGAVVVEHDGAGVDVLDHTARTISVTLAEREEAAESVIVVVSFNHGYLRPDLPDHEHNRTADLRDYVSLPTRLIAVTGGAVDLVVIDGRHRRRCVLAAADVAAPDGYVILHDAWRAHYQCAWSAWRSGRRFGDEWWIGAQRQTDFTEMLPWYALERHGDP